MSNDIHDMMDWSFLSIKFFSTVAERQHFFFQNFLSQLTKWKEKSINHRRWQADDPTCGLHDASAAGAEGGAPRLQLRPPAVHHQLAE